jgi:hypothetical protein
MPQTATKPAPSRTLGRDLRRRTSQGRAPRIELVLLELRRFAHSPLVHRHVKTPEVRR